MYSQTDRTGGLLPYGHKNAAQKLSELIILSYCQEIVVRDGNCVFVPLKKKTKLKSSAVLY